MVRLLIVTGAVVWLRFMIEQAFRREGDANAGSSRSLGPDVSVGPSTSITAFAGSVGRDLKRILTLGGA
jgi:hypothetical protein